MVSTTARADALSRDDLRVKDVVEAALANHPELRAGELRAQATRRSGEAEGSLPAPEVMLQVWQVPLSRPWAVSDAQMIMAGVGQTFPAPGSLGARQRAAAHEANAERAATLDAARRIKGDVAHSFADYVESASRHRVHEEHRRVGQRTVELARARLGAGGSLSEVAQAEVELARSDADVVTDGTRVAAARQRINALVGRDLSAPLGKPALAEPEISAWDVKTAIDAAHQARPELHKLEAKRDARREEAHAAERSAALPSFSVAALYFAPTSTMSSHGYGANVKVDLPWLWGEASARRDAKRAVVRVAEREIEAERRPIDAEVATAEATVRAAAARLVTLERRALPAAKRAHEVAWSGYETGRVDVMALLSSDRTVVDVESEIVAARAMLEHALVDLDVAVGRDVPRAPLPREAGQGQEVDHDR